MSNKNINKIQEQVKKTVEKIANMTPEQREEFDRNYNMMGSIIPEDFQDEEDED